MPTPTLSARGAAVLEAVVERFILTGEPVGSSAVTRLLPERVSPATVRNVMAELERLGYLVQPHTSAGRLPTAAGYGRYVEGLLAERRLQDFDESELRARLADDPLEIHRLLERSCRALAELSDLVGLVSAPPLAETFFQHLDFVALEGNRLLAIIVGRGGQVTNRIVHVGKALPQEQLDRAAHYLERRFAGRSLRDVAFRLGQLHAGASERLEDFEHQAIQLGARSFADDLDSSELLVEGASRLLVHRDFEAREDLQAVLAALEERTPVSGALRPDEGTRHARVMIGTEALPQSLGGCAIVAATYRSGGQPLGSVAILGPTRLHYARAIALVESMARVTTALFTQLRV
jgi:heat-inducible transcriptional repressor